jgi:hypothetical protein
LGFRVCRSSCSCWQRGRALASCLQVVELRNQGWGFWDEGFGFRVGALKIGVRGMGVRVWRPGRHRGNLGVRGEVFASR